MTMNESHKHTKQKAIIKHIHSRGRERWTERTDTEEKYSARKNQVNSLKKKKKGVGEEKKAKREKFLVKYKLKGKK